MNIVDVKFFFSDLIDSFVELVSTRLPPWIARRIPEYIKQINREAYERGYRAALKIGTQEGYTKGFDEGKNIWVIDDQRLSTEPQPLDTSVYGPTCFSITEEMRSAMRAKVGAAVEKRLIDMPTEAQWAMIFSEIPATCVIAGAGSGKSTTLILRIIFMLEHCHIPQKKITVVSFTTAACEELRKSLIQVSAHWRQQPLTDQDAKSLVRTFHSALYSITKSVFGEVIFFENIGKDKTNKTENEKIDELQDEDIENSALLSQLNVEQIYLLKNAYIEFFEKDQEFKKHVVAMMEISLSQVMSTGDAEEEYKKGIFELASQRDKQLVEKVNIAFAEKGYLPNSDFQRGPIECFSAYGQKFFANGLVTSTQTYVFFGGFGGDDSFLDPNDFVTAPDGSKKLKIYQALKVKKNIVAQRSDSKIFYIDSKNALEWLNLWISTKADERSGSNRAPIFDIQLNGEIRPTPIFEAFFAQASFIQSMGIDVPAAIKTMAPFRTACLEYHFCHALSRFWLYFEQTLKDKNIITFNYAFLLLAGNGGPRAKPPARSKLEPFTHLLIDEFQDISPQIVAWLLNCQRQILNLGGPEELVSIMAIGDDWQSIYGWRGSAPTFFTDFDRHFPAHASIKVLKIKMVENFRSIDSILRGAESLLQSVSSKTHKNCKAVRSTEDGDHGIILQKYEKLNKETHEEIARLIIEQYEFTKRIKKPYKNKVMVMSRKNGTLEALKKIIGRHPGIVFYTYHRAKGLQAEVAVMVEDCSYDEVHTLRNRIYGCTPAFPKNYSYDQAQIDEAARLAYVGATRGIRRVFWFVPKSTDGASKKLMEY